MAASKLALLIEQGATFRKYCQLSTGGTVDDGGDPVDLTGAEIRMQIRRNINAEEPLLDLTSAGAVDGDTGIYLSGAATGEFYITVTDEDTAAISWVSGVYDLEVEFSGGNVKRYLYGGVKVRKEVTR